MRYRSDKHIIIPFQLFSGELHELGGGIIDYIWERALEI